MKNKKVITFMLIIAIASSVSIINVYSEVIKKQSRESYIASYIIKNPEYLSIDKSIQKNILGNYSTENRLAEIEQQITASENKIISYKNQYKETGISQNDKYSIQISIDNEIINSFELKIKKVQYEMQDELEKLYEKYTPQIKKQQEENIKYNTMQKLNNKNLYEAQLKYLKACESLKEKELDVEKARNESGYSIQVDVDLIMAELSSLKAEIDSCKNELDTLSFELKQNINKDVIDFEQDFNITLNPDYDKYISEFKKKSYRVPYTKAELKIYNDYVNKLAEIVKEIEKSNPQDMKRDFPVIDGISDYYDRVKYSIDSENKYYINEIELKKLSDNQYQKELELFVYTICGKYNSQLSLLKAKELEISVSKSQSDIAAILFEEGKIIEIDFINANVQTEKLELEKLQLLSQLDSYGYLLENCIYTQD